jgi:D-3-phosphoglycerate dehydrogenase
LAKFKVVLLEDRYTSHVYEHSVLEAAGMQVVEGGYAKTAEEIIALCRDADGLTVNLARLDAAVISKLERCKVIVRYGVGYDNVDTAAATKKGIMVLNVPDYCLEDVSDQALALFMGCVRKIALRDRQVRAGMWNVGRKDPIFRVAGKVFGIAGYGNIPRTLHRKLKGFGLARVLVFDPFVADEVAREAGAEKVGFDSLLGESDFISCHVPLNEKTKHLFNRAAFAKMKKSAIFVNTSRGGLVDSAALYDALKNGVITAAGIDVHEQEPVPVDYPLFELDNVILSDHVGWYSEESQVELQTKAAQSVVDILSGKPPRNVVNREVLQKT